MRNLNEKDFRSLDYKGFAVIPTKTQNQKKKTQKTASKTIISEKDLRHGEYRGFGIK